MTLKPPSATDRAYALVAAGRPQEALALTGPLAAARRATELAPLDQSTWGWLATAARAAGDPAYEALYDYEAFVRAFTLPTPPGWPSLDAFLADLAAVLRELHVFKVEPAEQSLSAGTQTGADLQRYDHPVVQAFFKALREPIDAYVASLGEGTDPFRSRRSSGWKIDTAWSVLLRPDGFHRDHFHPFGWISSAFYVELPSTVGEGEGREGWIKFGQPPFRTDPPMPPAHFVRPEPGRLVLFPSYMWHGTVPFRGPDTRLSVAFEVVPA